MGAIVFSRMNIQGSLAHSLPLHEKIDFLTKPHYKPNKNLNSEAIKYFENRISNVSGTGKLIPILFSHLNYAQYAFNMIYYSPKKASFEKRIWDFGVIISGILIMLNIC